MFGYQPQSKSKRDSDFLEAVLKYEDDTLAIARAGTSFGGGGGGTPLPIPNPVLPSGL